MCITCGLYHHLTVKCMPWHTKDNIDSIIDLCKDSSCWSCGKCKVVMTRITARLGELDKKCVELRLGMTSVQGEQVTASRERKEMRAETDKLEKRVDSNTNNVKSSTMAEVNHREEKRRNVVVFGIPEAESAVAADRIQHDKNKFAELIEKIGVSRDVADSTQRIVRLGKAGAALGRPRPMLAMLRSEADKESVLDKSRVLRTTDGINIKPDLTEMQRGEDKKLRDDVDAQNATNPADADGPFHWKVSGRPGFLRKVKVKGPRQPRQSDRVRNRLHSNKSDRAAMDPDSGEEGERS